MHPRIAILLEYANAHAQLTILANVFASGTLVVNSARSKGGPAASLYRNEDLLLLLHYVAGYCVIEELLILTADGVIFRHAGDVDRRGARFSVPADNS